MDSRIKIATLTSESDICANHCSPPASTSPGHLLVPLVCEYVLSGNQHSLCQQGQVLKHDERMCGGACHVYLILNGQ